jgi:hypothetical protein
MNDNFGPTLEKDSFTTTDGDDTNEDVIVHRPSELCLMTSTSSSSLQAENPQHRGPTNSLFAAFAMQHTGTSTIHSMDDDDDANELTKTVNVKPNHKCMYACMYVNVYARCTFTLY